MKVLRGIAVAISFLLVFSLVSFGTVLYRSNVNVNGQQIGKDVFSQTDDQAPPAAEYINLEEKVYFVDGRTVPSYTYIDENGIKLNEISEDTAQYTISAKYPLTPSSTVNDILIDYVMLEIAGFKENNTDGSFDMRFFIRRYDERYLGFEFDIYTRSGYVNTYKKDALFFDLVEGRKIELTDVFDVSNYLEILSKNVQEKFNEYGELDEELKKSTDAKEENFQSYYFNDNYLIFFFNIKGSQISYSAAFRIDDNFRSICHDNLFKEKHVYDSALLSMLRILNSNNLTKNIKKPVFENMSETAYNALETLISTDSKASLHFANFWDTESAEDAAESNDNCFGSETGISKYNEISSASNTVFMRTSAESARTKEIELDEFNKPANYQKAYLAQYVPLKIDVFDDGSKHIAITFDDGPSKINTSRLLDILEEYKAKATFFLLGHRIEANKDLVVRIAESGHEIGNHSYNHKILSTLGKAALAEQLEKTNEAISEAAGIQVNLLRPPYGARDADVINKAKEMDMAIVCWDIDPEDWTDRNAQSIANKVVSKAKDGSIILLHDIYGTSVEAAEIIISKLTEQGYKFVTVSELLKNTCGLEFGDVYRNTSGKVSK